MQKTIEILEVNPAKTGTSKAGKPFSITECECIVNGSDGTRKVGVLTLGRNIDAATIKPGIYLGTFDISVSYKDRKIGAEIVALVPATAAKPVPAGGVPSQVARAA